MEDEIQRALEKNVPLKSGGYLVIDQTEAMTTIDVNTGSFLGQRNLEETVYRTNLEAAQSVARQLRLRNLGGIIIIDFIDMDDAGAPPPGAAHAGESAGARPRQDHGVRLLAAGPGRDDAQAHDRKPGAAAVASPATNAAGAARVKTAETVTYEIFREITRAVRQFDAARLLVIASPKVVARITDEESPAVAELEEFLGKSIRFQADEQYLQEQFDVVLL